MEGWTSCARPTSASPTCPTTRSRRTTSRSTGCACTTSTRARATRAVVLLLHGEPSWSFLYRKMIPVLVARRAARRRARPRRLRPLRQAGGPRRLHLRSATSTGCAPAPRRARPARRHARLPGLGRADRPAARRRAPATASRRVVAAQHLPADRRPAAGRGLPRLAAVLADRRPTSPSASSSHGGCASDRRAEVVAAYDAPFPDDRYKAGARAVPAARADLARRPGQRRRTASAWERPRAAGRSRSSPRSPTATRSRAAATTCSSARSPAPRASRTRRSRAAATSCRRTRATSSPRSSRVRHVLRGRFQVHQVREARRPRFCDEPDRPPDQVRRVRRARASVVAVRDELDELETSPPEASHYAWLGGWRGSRT